MPDPVDYGLSRENTYFVVAMEFLLTPNNINVFARQPNGKMPVKRGNNFDFDGDDPIDFEDADSTLHFFFPKDYAWAAADSATDFAAKVGLRRYFYSECGKDYMLVGVPWDWIDSAPVGDLIIDPTVSMAASEDVWLESVTNTGNNTQFLIGKAAGWPKKRTVIKFYVSEAVPTNATVLNAQMKLYYYSASNGGSGSWVDRWVQAHQVLVSWNEAQATYQYRLTGTAWNVTWVGLNDVDAKSSYESTTLFQTGQTGTWKAWNLTTLTQKWANLTASNYGVVLWATNETTDGYDLRFYSSEYSIDPSLRPKLEITYSTEAKTVYFLKDHLGSVRATVLDSASRPVRGYDDYDPWGYPLALRTKKTPYDSLQKIAKNKFTGKERDDDFGLNLDYFGGRTYDWLIGRWPTVDPLWFKHPNVSPYAYVLNNPLLYVDPDGRQVTYYGTPPPSWAQIKQNLSQSVERSKEYASQGVYTMAAGNLLLGALSAFFSMDAMGVSSLAMPMTIPGKVAAGGTALADDAILFGQKAVSKVFSEKGIFNKAPLEDIVGQLKSGILKADDVPVQFVVIDGKKVAVDNRSLTVLSQAGLKPTKTIDVTKNKQLVKKVQGRLKKMGGEPSKTIEIKDDEGTIVHIIE